jgi:hypothetical protein
MATVIHLEQASTDAGDAVATGAVLLRGGGCDHEHGQEQHSHQAKRQPPAESAVASGM